LIVTADDGLVIPATGLTSTVVLVAVEPVVDVNVEEDVVEAEVVFVTTTVRVAELTSPSLSVTVNVTVNVPAVLNMRLPGSSTVLAATPEFPNVQE
jgi:hypothetical protein